MNNRFSIYLLLVCVILTGCSMNNSKQVKYKGKDLTSEVRLIRDKINKQAELTVKTSGDWKLFRTTETGEVDRKEPILTGFRGGNYPLSYTDKEYHIYLFHTNDGEAPLAERQLPIEGGYNFRELGGIRTKDGKYTRWGKVFRSDDLAFLSEEDMRYLNTIPLRTIVDFRSESEIRDLPDAIPSEQTRYIPLSITPGNLTESSNLEFADLTEQIADSIMRAVNYQLVTDPASIEQYKTFFSLLHNKDNLPLVFHCTAGKDRTGFGAYLFLSSLGVDEDTIMRDYLSSNEYLTGKYAPYTSQYPAVKPLVEVREGYLRTAINQINDTYGSVENYLDKVLKVDRDKMKEIYLY